MKDLKIRMDRGKTEVTLEGCSTVTPKGHNINPEVFLQIDRTGFDFIYCCLTAKRAERLRAWLTRWLAEQKGRKAKR